MAEIATGVMAGVVAGVTEGVAAWVATGVAGMCNKQYGDNCVDRVREGESNS